MKNKELKIIPPKGYEIDKENSTFECIKFKPKKCLTYETYETISGKLFSTGHYYISSGTGILQSTFPTIGSNAAITKKQLEKLLALNKMMNVARFLNNGWQPDWDDEYQYKWYINSKNGDIINTDFAIKTNHSIVYFKSEELAQQAIDILGEDTIRLALSTDW